MVSVRKEEMLTNGLMGIACTLISILDFFTFKDIWVSVFFVIIVILYAAGVIYRKKFKKEPWDELTTDNYAKARRITLSFVELTLPTLAIICILGHLQIVLKSSHILFYYGMIKLVQTAAFLYYDTHVVE